MVTESGFRRQVYIGNCSGIVSGNFTHMGGNEKAQEAVERKQGTNPKIPGKMFTLILWPPGLWFPFGALSFHHFVG